MAEKQLFNKLVAFTDIHFGLRNDAREHNRDCENFIYWFIDEAQKFGADTCIFLGDWHHNRARINVSTLNYSIPNIERLGEAFENFYFITGNHDLYYRDKREINSVEFGRNVDNVHIISEPFNEGGVSIVPWLVGKEWKKIKKIKCKYMFGHFELPSFKMNAAMEMPDTGELHLNDFVNPDYVFSGHFHGRQVKDNVIYIGNAFPHNYSDVGDDDRGMMFLEWGEEPTFEAWPDAPKYRKLLLSQLLEEPEKHIDENTYARVEIDVPLTYEEANYIREQIAEELKPRDVTLLHGQEEDHMSDFGGELNFESVDTVVLSHLKSIESPKIDNNLLADIYKAL